MELLQNNKTKKFHKLLRPIKNKEIIKFNLLKFITIHAMYQWDPEGHAPAFR